MPTILRTLLLSSKFIRDMSLTSFKIPTKFVTMIDELVRKNMYSSRGEFIKVAINEYKSQYNTKILSKSDNGTHLSVSKSIESFFDI